MHPADEIPATSMETADRRRRLLDALEPAGLDALIAYSTASVQANVRYLTDYAILLTGLQGTTDGSSRLFGSTACFLAPGSEPVLLLDQPWDVARAEQVSTISDVGYAPLLADRLGPILRGGRFRRADLMDGKRFRPADGCGTRNPGLGGAGQRHGLCPI